MSVQISISTNGNAFYTSSKCEKTSTEVSTFNVSFNYFQMKISFYAKKRAKWFIEITWFFSLVKSWKINSPTNLKRENTYMGVGVIKADEKSSKESLTVLQHHL